MKSVRFLIAREPRKESYRQLLQVASRTCAYAQLVVREAQSQVDEIANILDRLADKLVAREQSSSWPGTVLLDETATLYRYSLDPTLAILLGSIVDGLYDWIEPNRPEDLCIFRDNMDPWLVTISHERESALIITEDERTRLSEEAPSFAPLLRYP